MRRRRPSPTVLLARIRGHDLRSCSDADLGLALQRLRSRAGEPTADALLPECFGIFAEAIDRRLGVWRILDNAGLDNAGPDDAGPDDAGPSGASGQGATAIAATVADVKRQLRYRSPGDVMLSAGFYDAARSQDAEGSLRFWATGEQLLAAIHLFRGRVVQMDAGEGKTVAIAIAAALHAALGRRVQVITANDYLAERDEALLEPVYRSLGISSGAVPGYMEEPERRLVYRRDIVYGSMREFGFDHLRDNLKNAAADRVQQPLDVAIVDEADHALIDEAFMPLIISGNPVAGTRAAARVNVAVAEMVERQRGLAGEIAGGLTPQAGRAPDVRLSAAKLLLSDPENPALLQEFAAQPRLRRQAWALAEDDQTNLTDDLYYAIHPGKNVSTLTERGRKYLEQRLGPVFEGPVFEGPQTAPGNSPNQAGRLTRSLTAARREARRYGLANQVSQALRAHLLLQRDVDYLVDDDSIVLVDPHTGRPKPDSIYQHGLQAAVEAREGVTVQPERETLAQISVSGFVGRYWHLSGITGTALTAAGEFRRKYGLEVAVVPPVHPPGRANRPPVVYLTREDKLAAVVDEVESCRSRGQPALVGTRTVEQSEELSGLLGDRGVPHRVLNAVATHVEASIVREAGSFGAVTVATHMAGRGTDILVEPDLDARIAQQCAAQICRMLTDESHGIGVVEVSCPASGQAGVLESELAKTANIQVDRITGECGLQVRRRDTVGKRAGRATVDFALGLYVIGTEVHDSSRITLQLDGRSGRQGQFGLAQTFLSLEDRLVNLDSAEILRLADCRRVDATGRQCYSGPGVSRRIQMLQDAADREGEAQRALMQDFAAEFDRQTHLYHQRRQEVILTASENPASMLELTRDVPVRVASRLVARRIGSDVDEDYPLRFERLQEELQRDYAVDCAALYGCDLSLLPDEVAQLVSERLDGKAVRVGDDAFPELARLLYLQVCADLWPGHIAALRDSVAVELLGGRNQKSAVASHIRRCNGEWHRFWVIVDEEYLSRLCTLPVAAAPEPPSPPVTVSSETESLLARNCSSSAGTG